MLGKRRWSQCSHRGCPLRRTIAQVARVAADPALVSSAADPGGWPGLRYFRLHGSPVTYRSPYEAPFLDALAARLRPGDWCIFDNTASGAALPNAVQLLERLAGDRREP